MTRRRSRSDHCLRGAHQVHTPQVSRQHATLPEAHVPDLQVSAQHGTTVCRVRLRLQKTAARQACSTLPITFCMKLAREVLVRQSGQGCEVVLCLEVCLLTCYPGQELPSGSQSVRQRGEQQILGSNGINRQVHVLPQVLPTLSPMVKKS